ncbi:MAG: cytochrome c biogenesis CcdA family protein [Bacillota bacterium]
MDTVSDLPGVAAVGLAFVGGLLSSASPCVLAAMPAACALTSTVPPSRRLAVGLAFTGGTSLSLSAVGIASVYFGRSLSISMRPATLVLGVLLIMSGLTLAGLVPLPGFLQKCNVRVAPASDASAARAFVFGLAFGTVMTPCATPMLIAIIGYLSTRANPLLGSAMMVAYSLGHCALILAASLSWNAAQRFTVKYQMSLETLRKVGGVLMCVAGVLLVRSVL